MLDPRPTFIVVLSRDEEPTVFFTLGETKRLYPLTEHNQVVQLDERHIVVAGELVIAGMDVDLLDGPRVLLPFQHAEVILPQHHLQATIPATQQVQ